MDKRSLKGHVLWLSGMKSFAPEARTGCALYTAPGSLAGISRNGSDHATILNRGCRALDGFQVCCPEALPASKQRSNCSVVSIFSFLPAARPFFFSRFLLVWFRKRQERVVCVCG